ncbi:MAG: hypothetical protein M3R02_30990 [Chloroflexota bacterium]|nr:hypothetical protein [Chloroflexota bacterium]
MAEHRTPRHAAAKTRVFKRWGFWAAGVLAVVILVAAIGLRRDTGTESAAPPSASSPILTSEASPAPSESAPLATATSSPGTSEPNPLPVAEEVPAGNPDVYARIGTLTDCAALQGEWQKAAAENEGARLGTLLYEETLGYMAAAQARMEECGCL